MERHVQNATAVADWLEAPRRGVAGSATPGSRRARGTTASSGTCPTAAGAILAFGIDGGAEAGRRFIEGLELFSHLANVGDVRSLAIHPASTTHSQLTEAEQVHHRRHPRPGPPVRRASSRSRTSWPTSRPGSGPPRARDARRPSPAALAARRRSGPPAVRRALRHGATGPRGGGRLGPRSTVAYETWGTLDDRRDQRRPGAPRPDRRLPRRRPGRARPPDPRVVGRADRPGRARSTPTGTSWSAPTCWVGARAPPARRRRPPTAGPTAPASRW